MCVKTNKRKKKMKKQKKTTLTESQIKLKKYLKPIVEGILTEQDSKTQSVLLLKKLQSMVEEFRNFNHNTDDTFWDTSGTNFERQINTICQSIISAALYGDSQ